MTEHLYVMTLASILNEARSVGMGSGSSSARMKDCEPNAVGNVRGLAGRTWPLGRGTEGIVWGRELAGVALLCDGAMSPGLSRVVRIWEQRVGELWREEACLNSGESVDSLGIMCV